MSALTDALGALRVALMEEQEANAEQAAIKAQITANLTRRCAAENAVSDAHAALEELARNADA